MYKCTFWPAQSPNFKKLKENFTGFPHALRSGEPCEVLPRILLYSPRNCLVLHEKFILFELISIVQLNQISLFSRFKILDEHNFIFFYHHSKKTQNNHKKYKTFVNCNMPYSDDSIKNTVFCRIGSTKLVLPIRPKYGILNRVIRVAGRF